MNTTTAINSPTVLPESVVEEFRPRPTAVLIKLLIEPELAAAATRIHGEHGAAFTAFLLGEVDLDELHPEKLEEAFLGAHMASYASWEQARSRLVEIAMEGVETRSNADAEFKAHFDRDSDGFFRHFFGHMRMVRIGDSIHVFVNRSNLHDPES